LCIFDIAASEGVLRAGRSLCAVESHHTLFTFTFQRFDFLLQGL